MGGDRSTTATGARPGGPAPTLRHERRLLRAGVPALACVDEVGRGALSGPVTVGVVVVTAETRSAPQGVRDSKLLAPEVRRRLAPKVRRWAACSAVGHAAPAEIDEFGIIAALRLAAHRALAQLSVAPHALLLDGNHDYVSVPEQATLFGPPPVVAAVPPVSTMIKADLRCAGVAAASILAKTERDAIMVRLHEEHPEYGWAENKGYSAPDHMAALRRHGPTPHHRVSWRLPQQGGDPQAQDVDLTGGDALVPAGGAAVGVQGP
ncbi:MAG TPA: ribonuclease HII [Kineosporiaceae bacterium]|jgi:ribonuclease HII|nr:ribonuclease HII [Kineosporiaceae bacterium]